MCNSNISGKTIPCSTEDRSGLSLPTALEPVFPTYGATGFHGTRSGSLLLFTDNAPSRYRGCLLSMRELLEIGAAPFTGETGNSLNPKGVGYSHICVVEKSSIASALRFAGLGISGCPFAPWNEEAARSDLASIEQELALLRETDTDLGNRDPENEFDIVARLERRLRFRRMQLERWSTLSRQERSIVTSDFPVIYGIIGKTIHPVASSVPGDSFVESPISPEFMAVIYAPASEIDTVKGLLALDPRSAQIPVEEIEQLSPRRRGRPQEGASSGRGLGPDGS